ncbi:MAG TPA: hypothetical protein VK586_03425, partial [Streptosporangiaceae bacterium]|nr:hypothetical protein [Streptosporangiaceae bacterium]
MSRVPGVPRAITGARVGEVVVGTLEQAPPGAARWPGRELARQAGISPSGVLRIWRASGLRPWRAETFKGLARPAAPRQDRDVAGLCLVLPASTVVCSVADKPHIQARQRTEPALPVMAGVPGRRSLQRRCRERGVLCSLGELTTAPGGRRDPAAGASGAGVTAGTPAGRPAAALAGRRQ